MNKGKIIVSGKIDITDFVDIIRRFKKGEYNEGDAVMKLIEVVE